MMKMIKDSAAELKKGFTLIELLVVIGILAVLATAVVLSLNPSELIKQGRDSTRIADFATLNSAIALYLADVSSPDMDTSNPAGPGGGGAVTCGSVTSCTASGTVFMGGGQSGAQCGAQITSTTVDGTGWVPINFTTTSAGSPIAKLPIDPVNSATFFYTYSCDNTNKTFELNAKMESTKYATTAATEVVSNSKDGGNQSAWYEVGNDPGLNL